MTNTVNDILGETYDYEILPVTFSFIELNKFRQSIFQQFARLTKDWNDSLHSEWVSRIYLAAKMIYSSTLMLNTLDYSTKKNIRITTPYLLYYSLLNCCRALTFTLPTRLWQDGELLIYSHTKIANVTSDTLKMINKSKGLEFSKLIMNARDFREFFSYRFPANGFDRESQFKDINIDTISNSCKLLCELAQFTSECLEKSYKNNCGSNIFTLNESTLEICFTYRGDNLNIFDDEDAYRITYILRKLKSMPSISNIMTHGMTDDFFGSWVSEGEEDDNVFDPDIHTIQIFEFFN